MEIVKSDVVILAIHDKEKSINPIKYEVEIGNPDLDSDPNIKVRITASKEVNVELFECIKKLNMLVSKAIVNENEDVKDVLKFLSDMFLKDPDSKKKFDEVLKKKGYDPDEVNQSEFAEFLKGL